jgi:preprotein translocase SecE subunit
MAKGKQKESNKVVSKPKKESYAKQVSKELKLVKWPSFKEVLKYTISTIVMCILLCALFMLLNLLLSVVKGWFL